MYRFLFFSLIGSLMISMGVSAKMPNDPFASQWSYEHTGVYRAWDTTVGSRDVVVAVIDNGFDTFHPDLLDNVWKNTAETPENGIDDDKNGYIDDLWGWNFVPADINADGVIDAIEKKGNNNPRPEVDNVLSEEKKTGLVDHGTIVAGIIGAKGNNSLDGAGINWQVRLMNLKVLGNTGMSNVVAIDRAIYYAVDNGAHIINISMVTDLNLSSVREAIAYAYGKGVIVVAAAGNNSLSLNESPLYPICTDAGLSQSVQQVIGVSAIAENRRLTNFSNIGSDCIDITAPGQDIGSTVRYSPTNGLSDRYKQGFSGTSFATPMVSGAAALIKSIQPGWGAKEITGALFQTVHHTPGQDEEVYANLFGRGLLQIDKAVLYAASQLVSDSFVDVSISVPQPEISTDIIWVVDRNSGTVKQLADIGIEHEAVRPEFKGVYDIVSFEHKGSPYIATAKKYKKQTQVSIYNDQWEKVTSWTVPFSSAVSLMAHHISHDEGVEIVVAPRTASRTLFISYSFEGKKVIAKTVPFSHNGVSLAAFPQANGPALVAALHKAKQGYMVMLAAGDGTVVRTFSVPWLKTLGSLGAGDINGNGTMDIVVGAGKGQESLVAYYSGQGEFVSQFLAFNPAYMQGVDVLTGNQGGMRADQVFLGSVSGSEGVYQPASGANKAKEWLNLGKKGNENVVLLIQPFPLTK